MKNILIYILCLCSIAGYSQPGPLNAVLVVSDSKLEIFIVNSSATPIIGTISGLTFTIIGAGTVTLISSSYSLIAQGSNSFGSIGRDTNVTFNINERVSVGTFNYTGTKVSWSLSNDYGNDAFYISVSSTDRTGSASTILPITLKSFTATKLEGSNAILNWTTSSERNASHFEIECSFDLENWQTLGQEEARGQHGIDSEYSYLDQNIIAQRKNSGVVYYRLQIVDIDGTRKTSDIRSINLDPLTETYYQAFPNPAKGTLNVQLQVPGTTEDMTSLFFIDNAGKLYSKTAISTNGITTLDVNDLPKGVYHLQVNTGSEVLTKKVILVQD